MFVGEVYDFSDPNCCRVWRVRCPDGDLEELKGEELRKRKQLATTSALAVYSNGGSGWK